MKKLKGFCTVLSFSGAVAMVFVASLLFVALFAGSFPFHSHILPSGNPLSPPSSDHIFGTDDLGVDIWSQIAHGSRVSLFVGTGTALLAALGGSVLGIAAGFAGGRTDRILMRVTDVMIIIPDLPLLILIGAFFGAGTGKIVLVLALFSWTVPARIVRAKVLSMKSENYIKAAVSFGARFPHLFAKHFFPALFPILSVCVIKLTGKAIVAEAGLSLLGLGDPLSRSWGIILNHAVNFSGIYFTDYWKWWITAPLAAITLLVLSIAVIARDLETRFNTKGYCNGKSSS